MESGISLGRIGDSAYRAFAAACQALQLQPMDYVLGPWVRIADVLSNNDGVFTVAQLGEHVRQLFLASCEMPADEVDGPVGEKAAIAWQAAGLHLFNLIQGGEEKNIRTLESEWAAWALEQLSPAHSWSEYSVGKPRF